jgi:hypothetical protein
MKNTSRLRRPVKLLSNLFSAGLLALAVGQTAFAQDTQAPPEEEYQPVQQFGGPSSVPGQLADDRRLDESLTGVDMPESWAAWKKRLLEEHGLDFTIDYNESTRILTKSEF